MRYLMMFCFLAGLICNSCTPTEQEVAAPVISDYSDYQRQDLGDGLEKALRTGQSGAIVEEGYLVNGMKNGAWVTYSNEGKIKTLRSYINDRLCGPEINFNLRLQVLNVTTYENDMLNGVKAKYKSGRSLEELRYVKNKLHGTQRFYFESARELGKLQRSVDYKNGFIDGKMRYYSPEGKMTVEYEYKHGDRIGGGMVKEEE